jgi:membrane dipeptidase
VDYFYQQLGLYSEYIYPLTSPGEYCESESKVAALLHLEGAEALGGDLEILRVLYRLGLRSLGLTWNHRNLLADGVGEGKHAHGLSRAGVNMIKEMNNLGMMLDLSHLAPAGFYQAIETSDNRFGHSR